MKCTACGMPLSPSRTNGKCPRCGTLASAGAKSAGRPGQFEPVAWKSDAAAPVSVGAPQQDGQWRQVWSSSGYQPPAAPAPQAGQLWNAASNGAPGPGSFSPMPPAPGRRPPNLRFSFLVAGVCLCIGGILLLAVYFMAMGQSGNASRTGNNSTGTPVSSSPTVTPSSAGSPSPTTASYPGQQYITDPQLSSVQPSASQPAAPATTFKVHETFYVLFNIHSGGQAGAICMEWYLNGKSAFNFSFPVGPHTTASYGQATLDLPGSGYVELYWASSKDCAGEVLAQHVDFTITT
jgi:hypothetical protein